MFLSDEPVQYCVTGINDKPALVIRSNDYEGFEKSELMSRIKETNKRLPVSKKLSEILLFRDELPKTAKGEIAKFKLSDEIGRRKSQNTMKELILTGRRKIS